MKKLKNQKNNNRQLEDHNNTIIINTQQKKYQRTQRIIIKSLQSCFNQKQKHQYKVRLKWHLNYQIRKYKQQAKVKKQKFAKKSDESALRADKIKQLQQQIKSLKNKIKQIYQQTLDQNQKIKNLTSENQYQNKLFNSHIIKQENNFSQKITRKSKNNYIKESQQQIKITQSINSNEYFTNQQEGYQCEMQQKRKCSMDDHMNQNLNFICFDKNCQYDRLICNKCKDQNHKSCKKILQLTDQKIFLEGKQIMINSHIDQQKIHFDNSQTLLLNIVKTLQNGFNKFKTYKKKILQKFEPQFYTINQSFNQNFLKQFKDVLFNNVLHNNDYNRQRLENYIQIINFKYKCLENSINLADTKKIMKILSYQEIKSKSLIHQSFLKIHDQFKKLEQSLNQLNFFRPNIYEKAKQYFNKPYPLQVKLMNLSQNTIQKIIKKVNRKSFIQKIKITDSCKSTIIDKKKILKEIFSMPLLKQIIIWPNYNLSSLKLIKSLQGCSNPNLQSLKLLLMKQKIEPKLVRQLSQSFPCLKQLVTIIDIQQFSQYRNYWSWTKDYQPKSMNLQTYMLLSEKLKKLRKILITENNDKKIIQVLKKLPSITSLQFKFLQQKVISEQLNQELLKLNKISHLYFRQIKNCSTLIPLIKKNKTLKTILFNHCIGDFDPILDAISKSCNNLTQLMLWRIQIQSLKSLSKLKKLKLLILSDCQLKQKSKQNFKTNIDLGHQLSSLQNLQHLQIEGQYDKCKWMNDQILKNIGKYCLKLMFLGLNQTDVTGQGLKGIYTLKQLKTLRCGCTLINGKDIVQLIKNCQKIQKLMVNELTGKQFYLKKRGEITQQDFKQISKFKKLTHLNIYGCNKISVQILLKFENLKRLRIREGQFAEEQINKLKEKNIIVDIWSL